MRQVIRASMVCFVVACGSIACSATSSTPSSPTEDAGVPGSTGPQGPVGAQGVPGAPGATGPAGGAGPAGAPGATGPAGSTGPAGVSGPSGSTGAAGSTGATGPAGQPGSNGDAGATSLVTVTTEPPGVNCPNGGVRIDTGIDTNGNGVLDPSEIQSTAYVCNGGLIPGPSGSTLTAGLAETCARRSTGQLLLGEERSRGEVGDGTTTERTTATAVSGIDDGIEIESGLEGSTACARRATGAAYCWGYNADGEVGDGSTTERHVPTGVMEGVDFSDIGVGQTHVCAIRAGAVFLLGRQRRRPTRRRNQRAAHDAAPGERDHRRGRRRGGDRFVRAPRLGDGRVLGRQHVRPDRRRNEHRADRPRHRQRPHRGRGAHGRRAARLRAPGRGRSSAGGGTRAGSSATGRRRRGTSRSSSAASPTRR